MKKTLFLLSFAVLALSSNHAKASPAPKDDNPTISAEVLSDMATPVVFQYEARMNLGEYFVAPISPVIDVAAAPTSIQAPEKVILNKDPLVLDERLWIYRHYFNPEDNKKYPEYKPDKLSNGFPLPVFVPVR